MIPNAEYYEIGADQNVVPQFVEFVQGGVNGLEAAIRSALGQGSTAPFVGWKTVEDNELIVAPTPTASIFATIGSHLPPTGLYGWLKPN